MPVSLNHTIVVARDKTETAAFLTEILGLPPHKTLGHFAVVQVDDTSLDFVESDAEISQRHFAFLVSEVEFDAIFERIRARGLPYWADPFRREAGRINHWDDGRGIYFDDPNGHLLEVITRPYGSGGLAAANPNPLLSSCGDRVGRRVGPTAARSRMRSVDLPGGGMSIREPAERLLITMSEASPTAAGHEAMHDELSRYHRQMLLPGFGEDGQRRLLASTALVLGCGALGSLIADLLARAGVGHLVIVDRDLIELTNLQRQVLFDEQDVADSIPKAEAARRRIARINSTVRVTAVVDDLNHANIERYATGAGVLVDGLDNFETRYLANDFAVKHGVPYIYGGAVGTVGAAYAILPHTSTGNAPWEQSAGGSRATPCLRCLFEEAPPPGASPTCDTVGVLGPAVAMIASFQAAEALKVLSGNFANVCPTLLNVDVWANTIAQLKVGNAYDRGDCPCCKHGRFEYLDGERGSGATTLCGRNAVQLTHKQASAAVDFDEIAARLREHGNVVANRYMLRAEITERGRPFVLSLFPDGRAIVHGTADASVARSVYSKYVGI